MRDRPTVIAMTAISVLIAACVVVMVWAIRAEERAHGAWVEWCHAESGHVVSTSDTRVTTVIDARTGQPAVGVSTDTTYYCLNGVGGIIAIR